MKVLTLEKNGIIRDATGSPGQAWGRATFENVASGPIRIDGDGPLVAWSGWFEEDPTPDGQVSIDPARGPFPPDTRSWGPAGRARAAEAWSELDARARGAGVQVAIRPHARHFVSDAASLAWLLEAVRKRHDGDQSAGSVGVVLDLGAILTASMARDAEDHWLRILGAWAGRSETLAVIATNVALVDRGQWAGELMLAPVHQGLVPPAAMAKVLRAAWPPKKPIILAGEDARAQRAALGV